MLGVYMALLETEEDRERFDKLYRQYREQLFRIALSVMKDICSAEDVVSEVFMIIAKNFSALRKKNRPGAVWIYCDHHPESCNRYISAAKK